MILSKRILQEKTVTRGHCAHPNGRSGWKGLHCQKRGL